ncbi:glycosyltransferase [Streptomyces sp. BE147]|uniref:glycosyltransferase n=1 Tax=unclassified Streptomyces TaxID=2593676 RepID=UPI002E759C25|nr:glycosyltransferase [Streptomyces sp. BE147]MEE1742412.1 glycosyltransferase [Streptomyces sp. BE147]
MLNQQVSLLRAAGVEAFRWTPTPGFRYTWFDDDVPTLSGMTLDLGHEDVLVLHEVSVLPNHDPAPGGHKVIYSQGHYLNFLTCPAPGPYPGWSERPALWAISRAGVDMLRRALPGFEPHLVPNVVDTELFRPASTGRVRRIAWMSRKRPIESTLLRRLLHADPRSTGVDLYDIHAVPHEEVARVMSKTAVFIALAAPEGEGFGLPPAEAMASGCLVTGYAGGGGSELFDSPSAWRVPELETAQLADKALELLDLPGQDRVRRAGRRWVADRYTAQAATEALIEGVRQARALPGGSASATHPTAWMEELLSRFPVPPETNTQVERSATGQ